MREQKKGQESMKDRTIGTVERERERESYSLENTVYINNKKGNIDLSGKYNDTG